MTHQIRHMFLAFYLILSTALAACSNGPADSVSPRPTVTFPSIDCCPSTSPSQNRLVYLHEGITNIDSDGSYSIDPDSAGIWMYDLTTRANQILVNANISSVDWSSCGEWIAFGAGTQIFKAQMLGDSLVPVSVVQMTSIGSNFFPTWSPNGDWIAFDNTSCIRNQTNSCGIFKVRSDGTSLQFVTSGRMPDWSPDGTTIVFIGLGGAIYKVPVSNPANSEQVVSTGADNRHPRYSPDGTQIAFVSVRKGGEEVWIMQSDGSGLRKLVSGSWPAWVPDGTSIVFQYSPESLVNDSGTLWMIGADGSGLSQITYGPE